MAQQCGPIFLECTWDDLTFYKMEGRYFVRKKSRLTRNKVLTHRAFQKTRFYAGRLATASKIASSIYSDLPLNWRQFWMFRHFTGEAMTMLNNDVTPQKVYNYLWKTYVEYWVLYQQATGIPLPTGRKAQPIRPPKTYKTRLKHRTENPKCRRYRKLVGPNHWKSSYDNTAELLEKERKRIAREKNLEWLEEQKLKGRWKEEEERWRKMQAKKLKLKPPGKPQTFIPSPQVFSFIC
jgi:hypothetical protein